MRVRAGLVLAACLLASVLGACSRQAGAPRLPAPRPADGAFKVAILLPRTIEADGWTRSGYTGLLLIEEKLGANVAYAENVPEADFEAAFRKYADERYDFIIGHGAQFIPAAQKAAAAYPRISFAVVGVYGGNNTNLGGISLREGEMAYLFGAIAALKTKTGKVSFLGGSENPNSKEIVAAFRRGAAAVQALIRVDVDWVGNFTDAARAKALAQARIDSGTDIIFVLAGAAGTAVHAQAQKAGIFTLAWIEDLSRLAPKAVITSNVQDVPAMLLRGATLAKEGRWEGKQYRYGLAEGVQGLAPFHGLLSVEQERRVKTLQNDLLSGKVDASQ
jgi:basic membrane protein A